MLSVVVDDKIPFIHGVLEPYAKVAYIPGGQISSQHLKGVDAMLIRTRTQCNAELLTGTSVRFIASATIGYDHIDTDYCEANNVAWCNAAGCNASSVKQYVLAALLEVAQRKKINLCGKTLGVVGVGNVGSQVAAMAKLLGMQLVLCDPPRALKEGLRNFVSLHELAAAADIVSVHVSLSRVGANKTLGLIGKSFFNALKPNAMLVNSSRGEVVDEAALKEAIRSSLLATAVDVWSNEPDIDAELLSMVDIATPHIAGYSTDGKAKGTAMAVNALARFFGLPLTKWTPDSLPLPEQTQLSVDFNNQPFEKALHQLVSASYPIIRDDEALRSAPELFEQQRGCYPLRREFDSFYVNKRMLTPEAKNVLLGLGFKIA